MTKKSKRESRRRIFDRAYNVYAFLMFTFLYIPVVVMIVFSFNNSRNNTIWEGFTTDWYGVLFEDADIWIILGTTLIIAIISTILAVVIGTLGAVGMSKAKFIGKTFTATILYIPIVIPEIVLAVATLLVVRQGGIGLGLVAMILGNTTLILPYVFITVKSRLAGMDPSIEEASLDLGADRGYTFVHVTIPAILPAIVSGGFMAFTLAVDDLIISNFLANAETVTLPIKIYSQLRRGINPEINAISTLILLAFFVCIGFFLLTARIREVRKRRLEQADDAET